MELVTEPECTLPSRGGIYEGAAAYPALPWRFRCNMERGQMRAEANVSISPDDTLGTRAEVKNLNSFNSVFQAIKYEIARQTEILDKGEKIKQETRGWDEPSRRRLASAPRRKRRIIAISRSLIFRHSKRRCLVLRRCVILFRNCLRKSVCGSRANTIWTSAPPKRSRGSLPPRIILRKRCRSIAKRFRTGVSPRSIIISQATCAG